MYNIIHVYLFWLSAIASSHICITSPSYLLYTRTLSSLLLLYYGTNVTLCPFSFPFSLSSSDSMREKYWCSPSLFCLVCGIWSLSFDLGGIGGEDMRSWFFLLFSFYCRCPWRTCVCDSVWVAVLLLIMFSLYNVNFILSTGWSGVYVFLYWH